MKIFSTKDQKIIQGLVDAYNEIDKNKAESLQTIAEL